MNSKRCVIRLSRSVKPYIFPYRLNNTLLSTTNEYRDLGVIFSSSFDFSIHISSIVSSALKILGFIIRLSGDFQSVNAFKLLYMTLVRSKPEYVSVIWSPAIAKLGTMMERVQHRFLQS